MKSFEEDFLERHAVSHELAMALRVAGEYRGKQDLFKQQAPQYLENLRQVAVIESTESSNRLEGVVASPDRIQALVAGKTAPRNRSEQEIAGYRDVLATIHANHDRMRLTPNLVLQLNRDLYQFLAGRGGRWKAVDNDIAEVRADGTRIVRFHPVPAHRTPEAMERLNRSFDRLLHGGTVDPLLLLSAYVLDFLCIHPFLDGNGRMARLLSLLLLYRAGYEVGRYISLERIVEETREQYYQALYDSSQGWHEARHSLLPWWEYFVGVVLVKAYGEFEGRVGQLTAAHGAKRQMVIDAVARLPENFQFGDVQRACPGVSRPTINRALAELRRAGEIRCIKPGREAVWEKIAMAS